MNSGFTPIRNAVEEHLEKGRLTYCDFGIYVKIHLGANYKTGVWWGSAKKLLVAGPAAGSLRRIQDSLRRLASIGFIKPFRIRGRHGNYAILINKFDLRGELKGYRVNADKTTDWRHPVLEARTDDVTDDVTESGVSPKRSTRSKPLRSKKKEVRSTSVQENFKLFWKEYPRGEDKGEAAKVWAKIDPEEHPRIMAGLRLWKRSRQWQKDGGEFVLYAVRFLKKKRWEETPIDLQPTEAGQGQEHEMVRARIPA